MEIEERIKEMDRLRKGERNIAAEIWKDGERERKMAGERWKD